MSVLERAQRILVLLALAALVVGAGLGAAAAGPLRRSAPILNPHMLAGSLGWMALAIPAVAMAMLADAGPDGSWTRAAWTVPGLALAAAAAVLAAGAALGTAPSGAVILFATGVIEWSASRPAAPAAPTTAGLVQVGALALASVALIAGVAGHDLALVEANVPLLIGGIALFAARVGPRLLAPGEASGGRIWLILSTVALAVDVGLVAHLVFEIGRRRYVSIDMVPRWLVFSVDHVTFVAVGASAFLGAVAAMAARIDRWALVDGLAAAGLGTGLVGTALGIGIGSAPFEVLFATVLLLSLLAAVVVAALRVSRYGVAADLAAGG